MRLIISIVKEMTILKAYLSAILQNVQITKTMNTSL